MFHSNKEICINELTNNAVKFRNFEGKASKFNSPGNRNFCVALNDELANKLEDEGFYIKHRILSDGDTEHLLRINVRMDAKWPPKFEIYTKNGKNEWGINEIKALDEANIIKCEVWFRPYMSENSDHKTAYLTGFEGAIMDNVNAEKYMACFEDFVVEGNVGDPDGNYLPNEAMPWD